MSTYNTGRSNERTSEQQAVFESEALWKKKKDSGYNEDVKQIDVSKFVEPMLAKALMITKTILHIQFILNLS